MLSKVTSRLWCSKFFFVFSKAARTSWLREINCSRSKQRRQQAEFLDRDVIVTSCGLWRKHVQEDTMTRYYHVTSSERLWIVNDYCFCQGSAVGAHLGCLWGWLTYPAGTQNSVNIKCQNCTPTNACRFMIHMAYNKTTLISIQCFVWAHNALRFTSLRHITDTASTKC